MKWVLSRLRKVLLSKQKINFPWFTPRKHCERDRNEDRRGDSHFQNTARGDFKTMSKIVSSNT